MSKYAVWVIDDEQGICTSLSFALAKKYEVKTFLSPGPALEELERSRCDLILLDLRLGTENGLDVLKAIKTDHPDVTVIVMTAYGSIDTSVEAMQLGAFSYLTKPLKLNELDVVIAQALEHHALNEKVTMLSDELGSLRHFDRIVGESPAMQQVYRLIETLRGTDANVLITGESGTGKELVAKAIHTDGSRKDGRFVVVNCAAIPENLMESELFGHRKGSFTGATADRKGKFEIADGGTIFLDEIGDMPLSLQSKLLRVLQDKEFTPLGAAEPRKVDVRVIAATNKDLEKAIQEKTFRLDLFYRLNVMSIKLPPLRERGEDIHVLCDFFIKQHAFEMRKNIKGCTPEAEKLLASYDFPGNVRQLSNMLEYAVIVCRCEYIDACDLPEELRGAKVQSLPAGNGEDLDAFLSTHSFKEIEKRAIECTLKKNDGRRDLTAMDLGISRRGLQLKMQEYGIR